MTSLKLVDGDGFPPFTQDIKPPKTFDGGGNPPDNFRMEARVAKLEDFADDAKQRLVRIESKLDHMATKAELADMKADLVKWIVGTAIALGSTAIVVMTFVLNHATPKATTAVSPLPVPTVIVVPAHPPASR